MRITTQRYLDLIHKVLHIHTSCMFIKYLIKSEYECSTIIKKKKKNSADSVWVLLYAFEYEI